MRIDAIKDETHIMTWKECRRNSIDRAASLKRQASIRASDQQYFCYKALAGLAPGSKQWEGNVKDQNPQFCLQRVGDENWWCRLSLMLEGGCYQVFALLQ